MHQHFSACIIHFPHKKNGLEFVVSTNCIADFYQHRFVGLASITGINK